MDPQQPIAQAPLTDASQIGLPPVDMPISPGAVQGYGDKPKGRKKWLFITIGIVIVLFVAVSSFSYALAYDMLPFKIPVLQKPLANFFMVLPFTPKTPQYILGRAIEADKAVQKFGINASIAMKSDQFTSVIGLNELDAQVTGHVDSADDKNPKLDLHVDITKEFSADVRKKDAIVYFKINKLPGLLLPFMGIDPAKIAPVLENWVAYDTTPLETDARKYLETSNTTKNSAADYTKQFNDLMNDPKVQKAITVSSDTLDGAAAYKITFTGTPEVIDLIQEKFSSLKDQGYFKSKEKLSDSLKKLEVSMWFDKKAGYTRKVVVAIDAASSTTGLPMSSAPVLDAMTQRVLAATDNKAELSMVMTLTLTDFGKDFTIDIPAKSIKPEEYLQLLMQTSTYGQSGALGGSQQIGKAEDAQRKNDIFGIKNALMAYSASFGRFPNTLSELVTSGDLKLIPKDPKTGAAYQYTVTTGGKGFTLKATLSDGKTLTMTDKTTTSSLLQ